MTLDKFGFVVTNHGCEFAFAMEEEKSLHRQISKWECHVLIVLQIVGT